MKKIEAIVKPFKVDDVKDALMEVGVDGLTTVEVKGFGRQRGHTEVYRGSEYAVDFVPKTMFIVIVEDSHLEPALKAIIKASKTGEIGDGKIFVSTIDDVIRIRTEETGNKAI